MRKGISRLSVSLLVLGWVGVGSAQTEPSQVDETPGIAPGPASAAAAPTAPTPTAAPASTAAAQDSGAALDKEGFDALLDRPGGLTSDEAAKEAAIYSRDAVVAQKDYDVAKAQKTEVIYRYTPKVTLTASYTRQSQVENADLFGDAGLVGTTAPAGPIDPAADPLFAIDSSAFNFNQIPNQYYLNAGVTVPISDYVFNMSAALAGVNSSKKSAELKEKAARVAAGANARVLYYDWVRIRLRKEEARKAIERAEVQLAQLKQLYEGGRVSRSDVLRQDAFLARAQFELRRSNIGESVARQQLHQAMTGGQGDAPNWDVGEDVLKDAAKNLPSTTDLEALQQEAIDRRLEIQALDNTVYSLRQKSAVERSQGYPRIEGFGNLTYANPNQIYVPQQDEWNGSWNLGARLTWTINDLGSTRAQSKATDAETAKIEAEKQKLIDAIRTEVVTTTQSLEQADLARDSAHRGLAAAEAVHEDRVALLSGGRATTLDLVDSEASLVNARLDVIDAYITLQLARVRFEHAVGRDIEATLAAAGSKPGNQKKKTSGAQNSQPAPTSGRNE